MTDEESTVLQTSTSKCFGGQPKKQCEEGFELSIVENK